ncbi:MAG: SCO family protein [Balneolaceae bacterium]
MKRSGQHRRGAGGSVGIFLLLAFLPSLLAVPAMAQLNQGTPAVLEEIGVDEKLGEAVPLDTRFTDSFGREVTIRELMEEGKPVLLNLLYYDCPMLCNLVVEAVYTGVEDLKWTPGDEYTIISVSIDPEEGTELAAQSRDRYLQALDRAGAENGWHFLTGEQQQIRRLAESVGFRYKKEERTGEYLHPAAIMFLSPEGVVTRYLYGIQFAEFDLRNALYESADGKIGSAVDQAILYCFTYDPDSESYVPVAINIMKLGGLATVIILGIFLGLFWFGKKGADHHQNLKNLTIRNEQTE